MLLTLLSDFRPLRVLLMFLADLNDLVSINDRTLSTILKNHCTRSNLEEDTLGTFRINLKPFGRSSLNEACLNAAKSSSTESICLNFKRFYFRDLRGMFHNSIELM